MRTIIRNNGALVLVVVALALGVAGCGDGTGSDGEIVVFTAESPTGYRRLSPESSAGFGFEVENITAPGPTIRVTAGEEVTVTFRNEHYRYDEPFSEPHNFAVISEKGELIPKPLWGSKTEDIMTGESDTVTFTPDTPGTYYYVCTIGDHRRHGMLGEFVVEP